LALGVAVAVVFALAKLSHAAPPSIEGSYILESRQLPDGKVLRSPEVVGMMTFTGEHRNFNASWTEGGTQRSVSLIVKYTFSDKEYTEQTLFYAANLDGKGIVYDASGAKGSSPVTMKDGAATMAFPLHGEPMAALHPDGTFIATQKGQFIDRWKKVQ